jgi:hypothetical protein
MRVFDDGRWGVANGATETVHRGELELHKLKKSAQAKGVPLEIVGSASDEADWLADGMGT